MTRSKQTSESTQTPDTFSSPVSPSTVGASNPPSAVSALTEAQHAPRPPFPQQRSRADTNGHQWNANSFFDSTSEDSTAIHTPASSGLSIRTEPTARSNEELLRKLSLVTSSKTAPEDPRNTHPALGLSGRLISATICVPHTITYDSERKEPWVSHRQDLICVAADYCRT